jgi:hypothetical protein
LKRARGSYRQELQRSLTAPINVYVNTGPQPSTPPSVLTETDLNATAGPSSTVATSGLSEIMDDVPRLDIPDPDIFAMADIDQSIQQGTETPYPMVRAILEAIDSDGSFENLGFPVVIFADDLCGTYGITTVDQIVCLDGGFLTDIIGMSPELRDHVLELSSAAVKAVDGKGKEKAWL